MENKLVIGMPAGSLANSTRGGNLIHLLEKSGFATKGYEAGGPTSFTTVQFLFGWDGRPQEFGTQLSLNELDVAIAGDDWIEERRLELKTEYKIDIGLKKILSLKRGNVRLVGIVDESVKQDNTEDFLKNFFSSNDEPRRRAAGYRRSVRNGFYAGLIPGISSNNLEDTPQRGGVLNPLANKKILIVASELPYMALNWIRKKMELSGLADLASSWSVQKYKTPPKIDKGILIYETWGKTEAKIKNASADIGLEITQSGSALRNFGLKIIDEVFNSETGIWVNQSVLSNTTKKELLEMFIVNLNGAINAENKVMLIFNVPTEKKEAVKAFLLQYNLYGDEPTVIHGSKFQQYSIQVAADNSEMPLAKVRYELVKLGAKSINTIPLLSSIPDRQLI